jgi:hypothetical protein
MFIDKLDEPGLTYKILKILRKLNELLPGLVKDQFFNNLKFPDALVKYLEKTKLEDLAGDAFILLINIFDDNTTPDLISVEFINKLMSSLDYIQDEGTLHSLVSILVCLLPNFEKQGEENLILKEFLSKEDFYREKLIYITNRGDMYRLDRCCKCLNMMLSKPEIASYYFNTNDLSLILDIMLREATTNPSNKTRV